MHVYCAATFRMKYRLHLSLLPPRGQVEDRRLDNERRLITLQVKNESLEKSHSTTRQQLKKLKVHTAFTVSHPLLQLVHTCIALSWIPVVPMVSTRLTVSHPLHQ